MFKISTKGDYGLLFMTALAEYYGSGYIPLKKIAHEKNLSLPYLSQIVIPLKQTGFIKSKEGVGGGYILAKKPDEISLMDILSVLEGEIAPVRCMKKDNSCKCEPNCGVQHAWQNAAHMLVTFFKKQTLADLINPKKSNATFTSLH